MPLWWTCLPAGRTGRQIYKSYMHQVYAIKSISRNYIYIGMTSNLDRRYGEHNAGREKTTKPYSPFKLIYSEAFSTRAKARLKEKQLKSGFGKEFLKTLI